MIIPTGTRQIIVNTVRYWVLIDLSDNFSLCVKNSDIGLDVAPTFVIDSATIKASPSV